MDAGSVQDTIHIALLKAANDIAYTSALALYKSLPSPVVKVSGDAYIPSSQVDTTTYSPDTL